MCCIINNTMNVLSKVQTREDFCGACIAGATAVIGASAAGIGSRGSYGRNKNIILWVGVSITIISIIVAIIYMQTCKTCR